MGFSCFSIPIQEFLGSAYDKVGELFLQPHGPGSFWPWQWQPEREFTGTFWVEVILQDQKGYQKKLTYGC